MKASQTMKKAISIRLIILTFTVVLICSSIIAVIYAVHTQNQTKSWLTKLTFSVAENYKFETDVYALSRAAGGNRVTLISPDGIVIADSMANNEIVGNHINPEELQFLNAYNVTIFMRNSETLDMHFMYASLLMPDGNILRLAHSYSGWLYHLFVQLPAMLITISIILILSLLWVRRLTKTITKPIEQELEINEKQLEQKKQDFFTNASHELKTPITSILGFSEMLSSGLVDNNTEIAKRIADEAKKLSELINDILTVSKLESNQVVENRIDVNFADIIKGVVGSFESSTIQIKLDIDDIIINADIQHLHELCTKLIENAIRYNKPNGTVYISLKEDFDYITLRVKDTGIGIAQEHQPQIFDRFFCADSGRDKKSGGTGLGLAIAKNIVLLYKGSISLKSKLDQGTEVIVILPKH